jgi:NitT/TauT family transport system substrate-binding protein
VLSIFNKPPDAIFTYEGSGIKSIKDISGRTLATATFTSSNALWPVVAEINGIDLAKVQLIKSDPATTAPMVAGGKADALINWVTSSPGIESVFKATGKKMVVLPWSDYGLDGYGLSLFASSAEIANHPDVVARFVAACRKAIAFSLAHPEAAADDLKTFVPLVERETTIAEVQTTIPLTKNDISERHGMGTFDPELLKHTWQWVARAQSYPADKLDPETVVVRDFVPRQ